MIQQQMLKNHAQQGIGFSNLAQHQSQVKLQQQQSILAELPGLVLPHDPTTNLLPTTGNSLMVAASCGGQSVFTDDMPSCSTSPSTNCSNVVQPTVSSRIQCSTGMTDEMVQSAGTLLSPRALEPVSEPSLVKDVQSKSDVKPSVAVSRIQNQGLASQSYLNAASQLDYLEASSSATSVCLSQNDGSLQQNFQMPSFNPQSMLFRETSQDEDIQVDPRNNVLFGVNIDAPLGIPFTPDPMISKGAVGSLKDSPNHLESGNTLPNYGNSKDVQQELSSSIVSQSFGLPEMAFNSIDSISDSGFLNQGPWAPPPQLPRLRTFTKVYKRGAVGRSIDIARYSGYDELKQDLARRFGIEGQLEDRQRIGWKLVYVDHENDVLLVGDDPWEEFVNCVRCIKILSPQEVQQMSLDGDLGNSVLPNQACSSSDGGNAWRNGNCEQNSGNPSAGSYE